MYQQIFDRETNAVSASMIMRIADTAFIPFDPANSDYQAYLEWVAEGNTPEPAE
tara:strand:- start:220 stop:381 length:162 start_codon:yes stop_codon:yes gene_type:complete